MVAKTIVAARLVAESVVASCISIDLCWSITFLVVVVVGQVSQLCCFFFRSVAHPMMALLSMIMMILTANFSFWSLDGCCSLPSCNLYRLASAEAFEVSAAVETQLQVVLVAAHQ
jgi:hypothetical protein